MSHNAPTQSAKETPSAQTTRMVEVAKSELDKIVADATKNPNYFGRPSIELVVQAGAIAAVNVNRNQSIK